MFPNVRLMVVAILAAIAGIGCGLGLFATFRINHEPLARLAEGGPPLQLAFGNLASGAAARSPLPANVAQPVSVPVIVAQPSPSSDPAEPAAADKQDLATEKDLASEKDFASLEEANGVPGTADRNDTGSPAGAAAADQPASAQNAAGPAGQQEAVATHDQEANPAATEATAPALMDRAAEQTAPAHAAAANERLGTKPKPRQSKAAPVRAARAAAQARRAPKTVRVHRTPATVAAQSNQFSQPTYSQPTYQWIDTAAQTQAIRRAAVKRHHTVKRAAPAVQSNLSGATAGLGGAP